VFGLKNLSSSFNSGVFNSLPSSVVLNGVANLLGPTGSQGVTGPTGSRGVIVNVSGVFTESPFVFTGPTNSWTDIPLMSITVNPVDINSKFKLEFVSSSSFSASNSFAFIRLLRNGVPIFSGNDPTPTLQQCWIDASFSHGSFFDNNCKQLADLAMDYPNTLLATTYKVQILKTANNVSIGRTYSNFESSIPTVFICSEILNS
jgi:hypothetical protein